MVLKQFASAGVCVRIYITILLNARVFLIQIFRPSISHGLPILAPCRKGTEGRTAVSDCVMHSVREAACVSVPGIGLAWSSSSAQRSLWLTVASIPGWEAAGVNVLYSRYDAAGLIRLRMFCGGWPAKKSCSRYGMCYPLRTCYVKKTAFGKQASAVEPAYKIYPPVDTVRCFDCYWPSDGTKRGAAFLESWCADVWRLI